MDLALVDKGQSCTRRSAREQQAAALTHRNEELGLLAAGNGRAHGHCLSGSSGLVEQGCVGNAHLGQVNYHGLEVEQGLQPAVMACSGSSPHNKASKLAI